MQIKTLLIAFSFLLVLMPNSTTTISAAIATINDQKKPIWLGDDSDEYLLEWTSNKFDLPGLNRNEPVTINISHYGVYPDTPRDSLWLNGIRLFNLGQSSWGSWGHELHTYNADVGFLEFSNTITIISEGLDHIPEWGLDDFMVGDLSITYATNPVPIPGTVWLLGTGIIGLAGFRRRGKEK